MIINLPINFTELLSPKLLTLKGFSYFVYHPYGLALFICHNFTRRREIKVSNHNHKDRQSQENYYFIFHGNSRECLAGDCPKEPLL